MRDLPVSANPALRRARPVFAAVALATVLSSAIVTTFGEGQSAKIVSGALIAIVGAGLWLIARGLGWARWLLTVGFVALGLLGAAAGILMLLFDLTTPQEPLSIVQTRMIIVAAVFILGAAAALFGSDALDELCGQGRSLSGPSDWDAVIAPESKAPGPPSKGSLDLFLFLRRWGTIGGWLSTGAAALAWITFLAAAVWLWPKVLQDLQAIKPTRSSNELIAGLTVFVYLSAVVGYVGKVITAFLFLLVAALFAVLPVALSLALKWKQPARFLVLRPFNRTYISRNLRRILSRDLAPLGHCYTLADADIRVALWLRLPLVLGQLSFFAFRQRKIASPNDIAKLVRAMDRRILRNFNWCVSRDKIFPVACVDAGWRACVTRLVAECDGVVMDLSGISESILSE